MYQKTCSGQQVLARQRNCCTCTCKGAAVAPLGQICLVPRLCVQHVNGMLTTGRPQQSTRVPALPGTASLGRRSLLQGACAACILLSRTPDAQAALVQFPASELHNNYILVSSGAHIMPLHNSGACPIAAENFLTHQLGTAALMTGQQGHPGGHMQLQLHIVSIKLDRGDMSVFAMTWWLV